MGVPPSLYTYIPKKKTKYIYALVGAEPTGKIPPTRHGCRDGRQWVNGCDTIYHCGVIPGIYSTVDLLTTMRLTQTPIPTLSWWDWSCHPTRPPTPGEKDHSLVARLRQTNASIQACDAQQSPVEMKPPHSKTTHTYPQGRKAEPAKHGK